MRRMSSIRPSHQIVSRAAADEALASLIASAYAVAVAADPMLAGLIGVLIPDHASALPAERPWRGDRRTGLEFCDRLLRYVRHDVRDERIDVSLRYIAFELSSVVDAPQRKAAH